MEDKNQIQADRDRIIDLGGPAKVAELLGLDKTRGGVQRVQNWMGRGIPAKEKLARPDLFLPDFIQISAKRASESDRRTGKDRRSTDKDKS